MLNFRSWSKEDPAFPRTDCCAKIYVFYIHKKTFIKKANCFGIDSAYEQAGSANPIRKMNLGRSIPNERGHRWKSVTV